MANEDQAPRKRVGRPPKGEGKRQNYTFRMNEGTRERLLEAAQKAGRSLSEEIEYRVERSVEVPDLVEKTVAAAVGRARGISSAAAVGSTVKAADVPAIVTEAVRQTLAHVAVIEPARIKLKGAEVPAPAQGKAVTDAIDDFARNARSVARMACKGEQELAAKLARLTELTELVIKDEAARTGAPRAEVEQKMAKLMEFAATLAPSEEKVRYLKRLKRRERVTDRSKIRRLYSRV